MRKMSGGVSIYSCQSKVLGQLVPLTVLTGSRIQLNYQTRYSRLSAVIMITRIAYQYTYVCFSYSPKSNLQFTLVLYNVVVKHTYRSRTV